MSTTSTVSSSRPERGPAAGRAPHTPAEVRAALKELGVEPSRRFGQSFLVDPFIADAETALVEAAEDQPVVEIGGGLGVLTEALCRRGFQSLTVVEQDRRFASFLGKLFGDRVSVLRGDARELPLPPARTVVGNLPFSVATAILLRLLRARVPQVVALVQREVAERLGARPGTRSYGRLTIFAALFGVVELHQVVPSKAFEPQPEVSGRIVVLRARDGPLPVNDIERFEARVRLLFSSRRKQLGNLLPRLLSPDLAPDEVAHRAGWPEGWRRLRPEQLAPEAYFALHRTLPPDRPPAGRRP